MTPRSIQMSQIKVTSDFNKQIAQAQRDDPEFHWTLSLIQAGKLRRFAQDNEGLWKYKDKIYVPTGDGLRSKILEEAHKSNFTICLGISKMYHDLRRMF